MTLELQSTFEAEYDEKPSKEYSRLLEMGKTDTTTQVTVTVTVHTTPQFR